MEKRIGKKRYLFLTIVVAIAAFAALAAAPPGSAWAADQGRQVYTTDAAGSDKAAGVEVPLAAEDLGRAAQSKDSGKLLPVYRFYHVKAGMHHWTTDKKESDHLQKLYKQKKAHWKYEGIAFYMPSKSSTPVYRLWNPTLGDHLWTTDKKEKDRLVKLTKQKKANWHYEGIAFYSSDSRKVPVWRFFTSKMGYHHWTGDKAEKDWLIGLYKQGKASYKYENVSYYAAAPDGWFKQGSYWTFWKDGKQLKGRWVVTKRQPGNNALSAGLERYWIDGNGNMAANRFVNPKANAKDKGAYVVYVGKDGKAIRNVTKTIGGVKYKAGNDGKLMKWVTSKVKTVERRTVRMWMPVGTYDNVKKKAVVLPEFNKAIQSDIDKNVLESKNTVTAEQFLKTQERMYSWLIARAKKYPNARDLWPFIGTSFYTWKQDVDNADKVIRILRGYVKNGWPSEIKLLGFPDATADWVGTHGSISLNTPTERHLLVIGWDPRAWDNDLLDTKLGHLGYAKVINFNYPVSVTKTVGKWVYV